MKPSDASGQRLAVDRQAPGEAGARAPAAAGPRLTASATSIGEPSGIPGGWLTVNSPRTSTGWVAVGRLHQHRLAVGVLQEELPVVRGLGLVPIRRRSSARRPRAPGRGRSCSTRRPECRACRRTPGRRRTAAWSLSRTGGYRLADRGPAVPKRRRRAGPVECCMAGDGRPAGAAGPARRRLPAPAGHRARPPGPRRRAGAASTSAPAAATCRWPWPRSSAATGGSTPSTAIPLPATRWPRAAAAHSQVIALTQAGEDLLLPEAGRPGLLPLPPPARASTRPWSCAGWPARCGPAGGWWPRSRSPRPAGSTGSPLSMPDARHPDVGALLPALVRDAGLEVVDAWAEAPAGVGPGRWPPTSSRSPGSTPGDDPVVLPAAGHRHRSPAAGRRRPRRMAALHSQ